jgi:hypothetical protein
LIARDSFDDGRCFWLADPMVRIEPAPAPYAELNDVLVAH